MSFLAAASIGSQAAGGIFQAVGASKQGQAQQQMYDYQASVAQLRANIDTQNAEYATQQGEQQAQQYGMQAGQRQGAIVAAQGASGLNVNAGSAKQVQTSQATVTALDLDTIRSNAAKTAYNFNTQAVYDKAQANVDVMAGNNAAQAGNINAASSILSSAGSVSSSWMKASQLGMFSGTSSASSFGGASSPGYGGS